MLVGWLVMLVSLGYASNATEPIKTRREADAVAGQPKLRIELRATSPKIKIGAPYVEPFSAELVNDDTAPVTVVLPGDGSESGWRTPIVRWDPPVQTTGPRCGNINRLKPEEVVTLAPGKRLPLKDWLGGPAIGGPGKYKVTLELENVPDLKWTGEPLGVHDPAAMKKVGSSSRFKVLSNVVEVEVVP
jgi:hypothetical protein